MHERAVGASAMPGPLAIVGIAVLTFVGGLFTSPLMGVASPQSDDDLAALRSQVKAYQRAWNTHDPSALTPFFADDADFVMGNSPAVRGRKEIENWWRGYFVHQEPERRATFDVKAVRVLASNVALINIGSSTGGRSSQHEELVTRKARGTWVLHRRGGDWLIVAMWGFPTEKDRVELRPSLQTARALRPQIRAFVDAYKDAFNRHDPLVLSSFYRDDADIIIRNVPRIHGMKAIRDWWRTYFSQPRPYRAIMIVDRIRMMSPDAALINVTATGAPLKPAAQLPPIRQARAAWVLVRQDGRWLIAALRVLPSQEDRIIREMGSGG